MEYYVQKYGRDNVRAVPNACEFEHLYNLFTSLGFKVYVSAREDGENDGVLTLLMEVL